MTNVFYNMGNILVRSQNEEFWLHRDGGDTMEVIDEDRWWAPGGIMRLFITFKGKAERSGGEVQRLVESFFKLWLSCKQPLLTWHFLWTLWRWTLLPFMHIFVTYHCSAILARAAYLFTFHLTSSINMHPSSLPTCPFCLTRLRYTIAYSKNCKKMVTPKPGDPAAESNIVWLYNINKYIGIHTVQRTESMREWWKVLQCLRLYRHWHCIWQHLKSYTPVSNLFLESSSNYIIVSLKGHDSIFPDCMGMDIGKLCSCF